MFCSESCLQCCCVPGYSLPSLLSGLVCLVFMLRYLIHLDLSIMQGENYGSISLIPQSNVHFVQYHLLKMLCISGFFIKKSGVHMNVDLCLVFCLFPLTNMLILMPIPCDLLLYITKAHYYNLKLGMMRFPQLFFCRSRPFQLS